VSINGKTIMEMNEVLDMVSSAGPGVGLEIDIWRGNERERLKAVTGERPSTSRR